MKAMILAAGLGTRLKPLTDSLPKPLVEVKGVAMIDHVLEYLSLFGVEAVIANTHHLAEKIEEHFKGHPAPMPITLRYEPKGILGTGGGLFNCKDFLEGEEFILCNADILTTQSLRPLIETRQRSGALASLLVNDVKSRGMLYVDEAGHLVGRVNHQTGERRLICPEGTKIKEVGFAAFHVIGPAYFAQVKTPQADIITQYLDLVEQGAVVTTAKMDEGVYWSDVGTHEELKKANAEFPGFGDLVV